MTAIVTGSKETSYDAYAISVLQCCKEGHHQGMRQNTRAEMSWGASGGDRKQRVVLNVGQFQLFVLNTKLV